MNRRHFVLSAGALAAVTLPAHAAPAAPLVHAFKSPTCGCCGAWVEHMRAEGFSVQVTEVKDPVAVRRSLRLPDRYASCHTATVAGYVLEGHVPAAEIRRLLSTRPRATGLAVPGMPQFAPGMEVPGNKDPYDVLLIATDGKSSVFASYPRKSRG